MGQSWLALAGRRVNFVVRFARSVVHPRMRMRLAAAAAATVSIDAVEAVVFGAAGDCKWRRDGRGADLRVLQRHHVRVFVG